MAAKYGQIRGGSWWIIALADQRMRSERMERIRREMEADVADGKETAIFDRQKPWDAAFLKAATRTRAWRPWRATSRKSLRRTT